MSEPLDVRFSTLEELMYPKLPVLTTPGTPMQLWVPRDGLRISVEQALDQLRSVTPSFEEVPEVATAIRQREEMLEWLARQTDDLVYIVYYVTLPFAMEEDADDYLGG